MDNYMIYVILFVSGFVSYLIGRGNGRQQGYIAAGKWYQEKVAEQNDAFFSVLREGAKEDGDVTIKVKVKKE